MDEVWASIVEAARGLEGSPLGALMRRSPLAYPAANLVHLAGLVMLLGGIGALDLRVIGLGRAVPLSALSRYLTPFGLIGVALSLTSGGFMFAADAGALVNSRMFQVKMALLAVGLCNAVAYRGLFGDPGGEPSFGARLMAGLSLATWIAVAVLGRLLGYL